MKNTETLSKPSSAGRVAGQGLSTKWSDYYNSGRKEKKTSSSATEVKELREKVAQLPQMVEDQVGATITAMMPSLLQGLWEWVAGGQQGAPRFPA